MGTETPSLDLAHYYPGWIWDDTSVHRMKSLLLYFDGFALLLPEEHFQAVVARETQLAGPLRAAGLLHNLAPGTWLDAETARAVRQVAERTRRSGAGPASASGLDITAGHFTGGLTITGGHVAGHAENADRIVDRMLCTGSVSRRRPDLGADMVEMPPRVRAAVLLALGLSAQRRVPGHRLHLVGDLPGPVDTAAVTPADGSGRGGIAPLTLHRDLVDAGVDLSQVPLDEILDFRREHGGTYRAYARDLRRFVVELDTVDHPAERERLLRDRSESIADQATALRRARRAWGRPVASLAIAGDGAAWTLHQADPAGAVIALLGAASGFTPPGRDGGPFTYLFEARRLR
ncbi:hypothetical protein ACF9IK_05230 [Kitasatospora hibisci]|uniref:hypothetical protein n=1 Tax=Kitasatospora hibisci TaxID=3369522 RepID=UPI00375523F1